MSFLLAKWLLILFTDNVYITECSYGQLIPVILRKLPKIFFVVFDLCTSQTLLDNSINLKLLQNLFCFPFAAMCIQTFCRQIANAKALSHSWHFWEIKSPFQPSRCSPLNFWLSTAKRTSSGICFIQLFVRHAGWKSTHIGLQNVSAR